MVMIITFLIVAKTFSLS